MCRHTLTKNNIQPPEIYSEHYFTSSLFLSVCEPKRVSALERHFKDTYKHVSMPTVVVKTCTKYHGWLCNKLKWCRGTASSWSFTFFTKQSFWGMLHYALQLFVSNPLLLPTSPTMQDSWLRTKGYGMRRLPRVYLQLVERFWIKLHCNHISQRQRAG